MTPSVTGQAGRELGFDRDTAAELAAMARRLGGLGGCLLFRPEGAWLTEIPAEDEGLRIPRHDTATGACLDSGRAAVIGLDDDLLHPRERALMRAGDASFWLTVPMLGQGEEAVGVVVGLISARLPGGVEQALGVMRLVADQLALHARCREMESHLAAERQQAHASEQEAAAILRGLRSAALVLSPDGRVRDANRSAELLLGFRLDECRGRPVREAIESEAVADLLAGVEATGGTGLPEVRVGLDSKTVLELRVTPVFNARGEQLCRVAVLNDTTTLRTADELKSEFISLISHELRTPLTSIKAFAATLLRTFGQERPEDAQEWLRIIDHECDRLTGLINDLLSISQLDAGRPLPMEVSRFDLMPMLHSVGEQQSAVTARHKVEVTGPASLMVEADESKLRQVVSNLMNNAVKYSPAGGTVRVVAEQTGDELVLMVQDQGVGIRPEHLHRVFEKFFQVDGSTTRRVGGTGLGLYLSRRLIESHGGRIWVESELGVGSTFVATLPVRCPARVEALATR
ncbi:MAG: PAS domain-containing protein [Armatimonadetes bacterium]|nr:PAS domain-containing protein [Armatimonadota bacterium]